MLKKNIGNTERVLRVIVGLLLIAGFFLNTEASMRWLYLIGIIPLVTGLVGSCGLYSVLGINTCKTNK